MKNNKRKKNIPDYNTGQYIKNIRRLHIGQLVVMMLAFILLAHTIVLNNRSNLKEVALAEVHESLQETVNNIIIHIDSIRTRIAKDAQTDILNLAKRMEAGGVTGIEDIQNYLKVCDEDQSGQAIEAVYTTADGKSYYVNQKEAEETDLEKIKQELYADTGVCTTITVNNQEMILFVKQSELDVFAKNEIYEYLHSEVYDGNQYVWVNEILNMAGGDDYAVRRIHPNLVDTEGKYLSTFMQDVKGNYPYRTELEGIRENGYVFHSYYFKNKLNDEITEKFSYAQYYEPFSWIVATGETIEEVYEYSEKINGRSVYQLTIVLLVFMALSVVTSGITIKILEKQTENFRKTFLKQNEVYEDIYNALSAGLMRIRVTDDEVVVMNINPKGLELLGMATEEEYSEKVTGHIIRSMDAADSRKLAEMSENLKKQWESITAECWVTWKDNTRHLLRIRDTLVDFDGRGKIIQRMCQDITEEYYQQERALMEAEEKANLDSMTQIKNKRAIENSIRLRVAEASRQSRTIAVGFADIDNFRDYNTRYGHMQGDEVIRYVADTLKGAIPGEVGRNGGDEFAFVMMDTTREEVEMIMDGIYQKLNDGVVVKETGEKISTPCSIGIVIGKKSDLDYDYVMKMSDMAMYEAKAKGKNTYYISDVK